MLFDIPQLEWQSSAPSTISATSAEVGTNATERPSPQKIVKLLSMPDASQSAGAQTLAGPVGNATANVMTLSTSLKQKLEILGDPELGAKMSTLENTIEEMRRRIDAIEAFVPLEINSDRQLPTGIHTAQNIKEIIDILGSNRSGDDWAIVLDFWADNGTPHWLNANELAKLAEESLASKDPAVRSAASRALAAASPSRAQTLLPDMIKGEKNKATKAAISSALRVAAR